MPDFDKTEYEKRLESIQSLMKKEHLPAILLNTEAEILYFTGFRTLFWQSPTRPWFLVVPQTGMPIAIIPEIGFDLMSKCWIDDIRCWPAPRPSDDGISLLESVLSNYSQVGLLMGHETHVHMPLQSFNLLTRKLKVEWCDATSLIRSARMIKSENEINLIRKICSIAGRSFDNISLMSHLNQPLSELFKSFKIDLLNEGADDVPYLVGGVGQPSYSDIISPATDTPLKLGDTFMLDTGAVYKGYYCDFDRNFSIGKPSNAINSAYRLLWETTELALASARPGLTTSELFFIMEKNLQTKSSEVGRLGHGLGLQLTEWPSIAPWDDTVLRENMVITIEPSVSVEGGGVLVSEENIVIRDGLPELLTKRATHEIPIII